MLIMIWLAMGLFTEPAQADCSGDLNSGYCSTVRATLIYIDANADGWLAVNGNMSAVACTASGGLIRLPGNSVNFKMVYATILAAHLSARDINIRFVPGIQQCTVAYISMP